MSQSQTSEFDNLFKKFMNGGYIWPEFPVPRLAEDSDAYSLRLDEFKKLYEAVRNEYRADTIDAILHSGYSFSYAQAETIYKKAEYDGECETSYEIADRAEKLMEFANDLLNC